MALLIKQDGPKVEVFPNNEERGFTLDELYRLLNCRMIEMQEIKEPIWCKGWGNMMILDEEGKLDSSKSENRIATDIWSHTHGIPTLMLERSGDYITGDVLICNDKEFK